MTAVEQVVTALIVDDQELVRSGLTLILQRQHGVVVVGECTDGDEVPPDAVQRHRPMSSSWICA